VVAYSETRQKRGSKKLVALVMGSWHLVRKSSTDQMRVRGTNYPERRIPRAVTSYLIALAVTHSSKIHADLTANACVKLTG
jgi:hypothetical protein